LSLGALLDTVGVTLWGLFGLGVWWRLRDRGPAGGFMAAGFAKQQRFAQGGGVRPGLGFSVS
jgi:hypothetical protein